jgi:hypothetical protein
MARVFTIDFQFGGVRHAAIVSTWKDGEQAELVQVAFADEALHCIVPEGKLMFRTGEDMPVNEESQYAELAYNIHKAFTGYLQRISV